MKDLKYLSWSEFDVLIKELLVVLDNELEDQKKFGCPKVSGVYGIPRGGLVPAVIISHYLKIPMLLHPANECIIVDDIYDSGDQIKAITKFCSPLIVATIYSKSISQLNIWIRSTKEYIVFPWEVSKKELDIL